MLGDSPAIVAHANTHEQQVDPKQLQTLANVTRKTKLSADRVNSKYTPL